MAFLLTHEFVLRMKPGRGEEAKTKREKVQPRQVSEIINFSLCFLKSVLMGFFLNKSKQPCLIK